MTRRIHNEAPEGAEFFRFSCGECIYFKCDEDDNVFVWGYGKWHDIPYMTRGGLRSTPGVHSLGWNPNPAIWSLSLALVVGFVIWQVVL